MRRALTRRCPYCGSPGVYDGYFALREQCPRCGVRFEREEGYFRRLCPESDRCRIPRVGTGHRPDLQDGSAHLSLIWQEVIAVALAIAFPDLFPFSRTVWIAMDLVFHPPGHAAERQLRGTLTDRDED